MTALPLSISVYASLDASLSSQARGLASDLRAFHRRTVEEMHALGTRLAELRDKIDDRIFLRWLEIEAGLAKSSAYRFMQVAEAFTAREASQLGSIGPSVTYLLAAKTTPPKFRADIVNRLEAGERMTPAGVGALLQDARRDADRKNHERGVREARRQRQDPVFRSRQDKREERRKKALAKESARIGAEIRAAAEIILHALSDEQLTALLGHLEAGRDWTVRRAISAALKESGRLPEMQEAPR